MSGENSLTDLMNQEEDVAISVGLFTSVQAD